MSKQPADHEGDLEAELLDEFENEEEDEPMSFRRAAEYCIIIAVTVIVVLAFCHG